MSGQLITMINVSKKFAIRKGLRVIEFYALKDINLEIPPSTVLGLVGESGSGKTTLGKITLGLLKPTNGKVLFKGRDLYEFIKNRRNRRILQYIPQDPYASLSPFKTIRQLLEEAILYHRLVENEREALDYVIKMLIDVGLTPPERYLDLFPQQLSGGERQRVNIARALILNPEYVVADEPTTMLDASLKSSIMSTLRELIVKLKTSLLFITHEISLLQFFGSNTNIAVIYLGKIVEQGTLKDLLTEPLHPYTKALIQAIPIPDPKLRSTRALILKETSPPSPVEKPPGCPLSDRCPFVTELCKKEEPVLESVSSNHRVACRLY